MPGLNTKLPWTNEVVKEAFEIFGGIARSDKYVYGGPNAVLTIPFGTLLMPCLPILPRHICIVRLPLLRAL